jgi:hypothetical protein
MDDLSPLRVEALLKKMNIEHPTSNVKTENPKKVPFRRD